MLKNKLYRVVKVSFFSYIFHKIEILFKYITSQYPHNDNEQNDNEQKNDNEQNENEQNENDQIR